jgi:hypothetical protein
MIGSAALDAIAAPSALLVVEILKIVYFITSELGRYFILGIAIGGFGKKGDIEKASSLLER